MYYYELREIIFILLNYIKYIIRTLKFKPNFHLNSVDCKLIDEVNLFNEYPNLDYARTAEMFYSNKRRIY